MNNMEDNTDDFNLDLLFPEPETNPYLPPSVDTAQVCFAHHRDHQMVPP